MRRRNKRPFSSTVDESTENEAFKGFPPRSRRRLQDSLYECNYCEQKFTRTSLTYHEHIHILNRHKPKNAIVSEQKKEFHCHICPKSFVTKHDYDIHVRSHEIEKPFECEECGMSFEEKAEVDRHRNTHWTKRSWQCNFCRRKFEIECQLKTHERVHRWVESLEQCHPFDTDDATLIFQSEKSENDATIETFAAEIKKPNQNLDSHKCGHCDENFTEMNLKLEHECRAHLPQIVLKAIETDDNIDIPSTEPNIITPENETVTTARPDDCTQKSSPKSSNSIDDSKEKPVNEPLPLLPTDCEIAPKETVANKKTTSKNISNKNASLRPKRAAALRFKLNISTITRGVPPEQTTAHDAKEQTNDKVPDVAEKSCDKLPDASDELNDKVIEPSEKSNDKQPPQQPVHIKEEPSKCNYCDMTFECR